MWKLIRQQHVIMRNKTLYKKNCFLFGYVNTRLINAQVDIRSQNEDQSFLGALREGCANMHPFLINISNIYYTTPV